MYQLFVLRLVTECNSHHPPPPTPPFPARPQLTHCKHFPSTTGSCWKWFICSVFLAFWSYADMSKARSTGLTARICRLCESLEERFLISLARSPEEFRKLGRLGLVLHNADGFEQSW